MVTRRRFSRNVHKLKLSNREGLEGLLYAEISRLLKNHDPTIHLPALRVASQIAAIVASQLASQTQAVQRALIDIEDDISEYGTDFVSDLIEVATKSVTKKMKRFRVAKPDAEIDAPLPLADDWAGPVAGPTLIERHFGIPRSTLYRWQKLNEVVAINSRTSSKPVFPLKQFVDGRPAAGIAEVIAAFGNQKAAWQWLVTSNAGLENARPIEKLLQGKVGQVISAMQKR